jgi:RHS repeat-associated protein
LTRSSPNRLASVTDTAGLRTVSYDARGNTVAETRADGTLVAASYDGQARLSGYERNNIGAQVYTYNGLGDRVRVDKPTGTRRFVYDSQGRVMAEYGGSAGEVWAEFIWALPPGANDNGVFGGGDGVAGYAPLALVAQNASGLPELYWVHGNHLGVPQVTTNAAGQVVDPGDDFLRPGFPGQSQVLTDLYYNRARDYDPVLGRYIQADPIGLAGGANPYLYANGDPVNGIDPLGLFDLRDAVGFVPVLGSGLDAYDAYNCGNYGWAAFHAGLAVIDLTGVGALGKGLLVGGFKLRHLRRVRDAYRNTDNWDDMRRALQKSGVLPRNTRPWRPDWSTTDHVWIKQRSNHPHYLKNHPANLQPDVTDMMNRAFEKMSPFERALHYPGWVKAVGAGTLSSLVGASTDHGTK